MSLYKREGGKMVFSSLEFIFRFLPAFLFIYYIIPGKGKNLWLLMGSLGFYFYGVRDTPFYFVLLILSILVNYRIGILIGRRRIGRFRRRWLIYGVIYNLFWLILFKYCGFLVRNLNLMLSLARIPAELPVIAPVLPVGISFIHSRPFLIWRTCTGKQFLTNAPWWGSACISACFRS